MDSGFRPFPNSIIHMNLLASAIYEPSSGDSKLSVRPWQVNPAGGSMVAHLLLPNDTKTLPTWVLPSGSRRKPTKEVFVFIRMPFISSKTVIRRYCITQTNAIKIIVVTIH